MKRLLTSTAPKGWVELAGNRDARWQGHFTRTDALGNVDVKNPLTVLLCRIESSRKRGRPSKNETGDAISPNVPKIHLTAFQNGKPIDAATECSDSRRVASPFATAFAARCNVSLINECGGQGG